ncbi:MAG: ATP synthase F1 subunit gamma [Candidatus Cloacimonetes bacterium]|nr:ATP synthase F1 subunit gamma [Candidatus Cloacimonadota bacterium]
MANLRDLKTRIGSVKSIAQITNAMKMVAAAKLRKSQDAVVAARPYSDHIDRMLRILQKKNNYTPHPLLNTINPEGKQLIIIVTSDKGLCGAFNSSIIKYAVRYLEENPNSDLIFFGRKGYDFFRKNSRFKVKGVYPNLSDNVSVHSVRNIKTELLNFYNSAEYSKVFVIYNEFKSAIQQNLLLKQLIPVVPYEADDISSADYDYEPNANAIIEELGKQYVNVELWRIILESNAAEQGARMTAMDNATTNAKDLIEELSLIYNRERQSQITTQIIEIASGAEAIHN